jgi:predicted dehydrogenase
MPTEVVSQGRLRGEVVEYFDTLFRFADPALVVRATSGVINQQGRPFTHGFEIHLEKATLHFEFAGLADTPELMPLKVLTAAGEVLRPALGEGDPTVAFQAEIAEVVRCLESGRPSAILAGDLARDAIVLCHRQTEAVRSGRPVSV